MSLQWALIAGFLYLEIFIVLLLVLPIASPKRWNSLFKSRFLQALGKQAGVYFIILLAILVLFCLDAIREMRKYSNQDHHHEHMHLNSEMQEQMRLFRAQRNFYISGFALFLSLVIRRLITLICAQANLLAQSEAALRQAQNASTAAKTLLAQRGEEEQNSSNEAHDKQITALKGLVADLEEKLEKEKKNSAAIKAQAESQNRAFDSLTAEMSKLQKSVTAGTGDKKDD